MDTMTDRAHVCVCDDSETNNSDANSFFSEFEYGIYITTPTWTARWPFRLDGLCVPEIARPVDRLVRWKSRKYSVLPYISRQPDR